MIKTLLLALLIANAKTFYSQPIQSILSGLPARCVGPVGDPGNNRISDIAVFEKRPYIFFISTSSGGVFKTEDGGTTFTPFFDHESASSIGATAVSQTNPDIFWVGTGEGWHRNSAGWGKGIYKTVNGGKTWQNMGLPKSFSFGKIIIHPKNNDIVYAAVLGSQWTGNSERGIYKTTDGGATWKQVLYVNEYTGAADLAIDPKNPNNLLAAMWDHERRPYSFRPGGPGSGIFRSTDGGNTWHKIIKGLPDTSVGRIALSFFPKDPRNVAAIVEQSPVNGFYRSKDGGETWTKMPAKYVDENGDVREENFVGRPFYDMLLRYDPEDVNKIYRSNSRCYTSDGGKTFVGGVGDDHALWIDPANPTHMLQGGDGGVTEIWGAGTKVRNQRNFSLPPYGESYFLGYDMCKLYHVIASMQDDASFRIPTQTAHGAITEQDARNMGGQEGGTARIDPEDWAWVYSGSRGEPITRNNLRTGESIRITPFNAHKYDDPHSRREYWESSPRFRAGWYSTFIISPWNSQTLYFGANYVFKTVDRGNHWKVISPDLTHDKPEWQQLRTSFFEGDSYFSKMSSTAGSEIYQTISAISESPLKQGVLWIGTDDGNVQLTRDDGETWTDLTANIKDLPDYSWVSSITSSNHVAGRAYITFDGHRNGDHHPHVYVTEDYGNTWTSITSNLPKDEVCMVIREGLQNKDLLFLGTQSGLYVSLDRGLNWFRYQDFEYTSYGWSGDVQKGYLPTVQVIDLAIQPREQDLIVATHGRSIWTIPIKVLEEMSIDRLREDSVIFFAPTNVYLFPTQSAAGIQTMHGGSEPNSQPGTFFSYYLRRAVKGEATIRIFDENVQSGDVNKYIYKGSTRQGLNTIALVPNCLPIHRPGDYTVSLTIEGKEYFQRLHVEDASDEIVPDAPAGPRFMQKESHYRLKK